MKNAWKKLISYLTVDRIILSLGVLSLVFYTALEVLIRVLQIAMNPYIRALALVLICIVLYCGGILHLQRTKNPILFRRLFYLFFALYFYLLLTLTLTDISLGRDGNFIFNDVNFQDQRTHYVKWFVNLIPFHSIYELYIMGLVNGYVSIHYVLLNLLGNLCLFMPFSFFMPLFFKKQRKWYWFVLTVLLSISAVESLQFLFMIGSCDVDDLILNATGAIALYLILKTPFIKQFFRKLLQNAFK